MLRTLIKGAAPLLLLVASASGTFAQEVELAPPGAGSVSAETAFILNTFLFLFAGILVMWMAAGFSMLEAGLVRSKNTSAICLKNIALYSFAGLM